MKKIISIVVVVVVVVFISACNQSAETKKSIETEKKDTVLPSIISDAQIIADSVSVKINTSVSKTDTSAKH